MGSRLPRPCKNPLCGILTTHTHGYCEAHKTQQWVPKKKDRGYGRKWRKIRLEALKSAPFCTFPGCFRFAEEVDHIDGNKDNLALTNLRPYCIMHHRFKTEKVDNPTTKVMDWLEFENTYKREDNK